MNCRHRKAKLTAPRASLCFAVGTVLDYARAFSNTTYLPSLLTLSKSAEILSDIGTFLEQLGTIGVILVLAEQAVLLVSDGNSRYQSYFVAQPKRRVIYWSTVYSALLLVVALARFVVAVATRDRLYRYLGSNGREPDLNWFEGVQRAQCVFDLLVLAAIPGLAFFRPIIPTGSGVPKSVRLCQILRPL
jgi:hypothetical protein